MWFTFFFLIPFLTLLISLLAGDISAFTDSFNLSSILSNTLGTIYSFK